MVQPSLRLLLTSFTLTLNAAGASGMLGAPSNFLTSSFCKSLDCGLVGRQHITSNITADIFVTNYHKTNTDGTPAYGQDIDILLKDGKVVAVRMHELAQDDPFVNNITTVKNTNEYLASDLVELLTGKRPTLAILRLWQKDCLHENKLAKLTPFAGHFLSCDVTGDRPTSNAEHLILSVLY